MVIVNVQDHDHTVTLDDAFDFINTLEYEDGAPVDRLGTAQDALAWFIDRGLVHPEAQRARRPADEADLLADVRDVRAALREVSDAIAEQRPARAQALARVNDALRARQVVQLEPADDGVRVGHRHEGDPVDDALARLAEPIVHLIAEGRPERLRVCANDGCRWVFFDASPTGRRRWCSMASCGNRAKAARHRARVRAGESRAD